MKRLLALSLAFGLNVCSAEETETANTKSLKSETEKMETVNIYLSYGPGTTPDVISRAIECYGQKQNIKFILHHKLGGNGTIGIHSFLENTNTDKSILLAIAGDVSRPSEIKKFRESDLYPIAAIGLLPVYIVARPDFPINNLTELKDSMIKSPDRYSWGMISKTFENYLLNFADLSGIDTDKLVITKFNTKGGMNAVGTLIGGHIDLAIAGGVTVNAAVHNNQIKVLGMIKSLPGFERYQTFQDVFGDRWSAYNGYGIFVNSQSSSKTKDRWENFFKEFSTDEESKNILKEQSVILISDPDKKEIKKMLDFNRLPRAELNQTLTPRQREIVFLISSKGFTNKQIAKRLNIGESVVKFHVGSVLKKYALRDRTHLSVYFNDKNRKLL